MPQNAPMTFAKPSLPAAPRFWADLKSPDFASLDLARCIAVLPVAAIEQHGPHLPLSVDTTLVEGVVAAALPHMPADLPVLFLPTQAIGLSPEHAAFAGTLTLKAGNSWSPRPKASRLPTIRCRSMPIAPRTPVPTARRRRGLGSIITIEKIERSGRNRPLAPIEPASIAIKRVAFACRAWM